MSDVLAEAVEAAAKAQHATRSDRPWDEAPEWLRDFFRAQARAGVAAALPVVLAAAGEYLTAEMPDGGGRAANLLRAFAAEVTG